MSGTIAIIPARGGSKGVPRKNLREIGGRPLIAWTIESARQCRGLDRVIVSTDDDEIRRIAIAWGAEAPFSRPPHLATDEATSVDVAIHTMDWLEDAGYQADIVVQLQPTSPLRTALDITEALALFHRKKAAAVVSVRPAAHPPEWLRRLGPDGELLPWSNVPLPLRRQDAAQAYELNGAVYIINAQTLRKGRSYFPTRTFGFIMPAQRSVDIDTLSDFLVAELFLGARGASDPNTTRS